MAFRTVICQGSLQFSKQIVKFTQRSVQSPQMRASETNLVTMRDIADLAGVSPGTVSRALKNQSGLTEETRQLILRCASELGYNVINLRPNKLKRVSFLTSRLPNLTINPFYEIGRAHV